MSDLRRCTNCVIPETHETIEFDPSGTCNICQQNEYKQEEIDWVDRKNRLDSLIESYRGENEYDCIVPFSGGKDSTWTLYYLVKEYGIRPLVVRFDHGFLRPNVHRNTEKVIRHLGVSLHHFRPNWKVVQKLMLQMFLEKGDFCWHCHTGIFAYPMWVAIRQNIPLVIWGEPSAEYTSYYSYDQEEEVDEKRFNRIATLGVTSDDMFIRLGGEVDVRELKPFSYPPASELRRIGYRSVCLGSYVPWDVRRQVSIIKEELDWEGDMVENVPPGYEYEKIECYMQGVRDYIKHIKRGYSRASHLTSIDIRNGRMDRKTAMQMVEKYEGKRPPSLDLFLDYVGLTEEEFLEVALSHSVSPYEHDLSGEEHGEPVPDFNVWPREGRMSRSDAERQLDAWRQRNGYSISANHDNGAQKEVKDSTV